MEYLEEYRNHPKIALFKVNRESEASHFYNLYCNHLLDRVRDGWILFLDDDNMLSQPDTLKKINNNIKTENDIIFWKVKLGEHIIFPNIYDIKYGQIDSAGFCFHSKYKNAARWIAEQGSDFHYVTHLLQKHYLIRRAHSEILTHTVMSKSVDYKKYNLIGFKYLECSISNNLYILKNYLTKKFKNCIINLIDINEFHKQHYITLCNNHETIICVQPIECYNIRSIISKLVRKPSVLWIWEFKSLPKIFKVMEPYFRKIYTQSQFCYDIFLKYFTIPIEYIKIKSLIHNYLDKIDNHTIKNEKIRNILDNTTNRIRLGFCFDTNSSLVRKNPINLVKAFNKETNKNLVLILKYRLPRNGQYLSIIEQDLFNEFIKISNENNNIFLIDEELDILDLYKLYSHLDYYISPHCGEGFGYTIYDNMILGTQIISPYYSGEKDYLEPGKFIELDYEETDIEGLKEHLIYGEMNDYKGAYVSIEEIQSKLQNIHLLEKTKEQEMLKNYNNLFVIDCQPVQHETRGIGIYSINLINNLIKRFSDVFLFKLLINNFLEKKQLDKINLSSQASFLEVSFSNVSHSTSYERIIDNDDSDNDKGYEIQLANEINRLNPRIFLNLSEFDRRKIHFDIKLLNSSISTFSILYDLIPLKHKDYLKNLSKKWKDNYFKQLNNLKKYNKLFSISQFTTDNCSNIFNNIHTIGTGVFNYNKTFINEYQKQVLSKFNITKKYIYSQSAFDNHKGFDFLYNEYLLLPKNIKDNLILVFGSNIPKNYIRNNPNIIITGYLKEDELHILHKNSWLFVFASKYEGFGLPPVEAMNHNKPVIVANNTSLIEVIDNTKFMFEHDIGSCASLILKLYNNIELYNECIANSIRRKDLFKWDNVVNRLLFKCLNINNDNIYFNGCHDVIKWQGYSLAEVNNNFIKELSKILNKKINVIENRKEKDFQGIKIFMDYPPNDFDESYKILNNWGWEESIIPKKFIDKFQKLDFITVISSYVKAILINNGVVLPIFITPNGSSILTNSIKKTNLFNKYNTKKYKFLHLSTCLDRKGIDELLEAYFKRFRSSDNVSLIIKTIKNIHNKDLWEKIMKYKKDLGDSAPEIHLIMAFYSYNEIKELIHLCDCQILPSKSEGFGLPALYAMINKKPVIFTNYSGYLDYGKSNPFLIDYDYVYSNSHFNSINSIIVKPKIDSIISNMEKVMNIPSNNLHNILEKNYNQVKKYTWSNNVNLFLKSYYTFHYKLKNNIKLKPNIAVVSNLSNDCGIGRYTYELFKYNNDITFLIPYNISNNILTKTHNSTNCWSLSQIDNNINKLLKQCMYFDIIIIQYNFGFFNKIN